MLFTYSYDHTSSPAPGIHFIQTPFVYKQALRLQILMSDHWPEEVSGVLSVAPILGLSEASLVPGYVRKPRLVLTNAITTELFRLSVQPQLCLNCIAVLSTPRGTMVI